MNLFISRKKSGKKIFQSKENTFYSTYITLLISFAVCWFELKVDSYKKNLATDFHKFSLIDLVETVRIE